MSKRILLSVFLFSAIFFVFFQSQSIFGGDAGDLVSAICVGGIPHPPGYPLYTILGRLFLLLPFFTPAWRVSLLSSLPAAGTITLVFLIIWQITKNKYAGLIGALTVAFNYLFWLYASVPEVFSLNNFFLMLLLYLTILIMEKISDRKLNCWFFIAGLSASHHHFSFWFYPVFAIFIYFSNRSYFKIENIKKNIKYSFFFILGLLPYLYIPIAAQSYPIISWNNPVDLENFWRLITRHNYGTFISYGLSLQTSLQSRLLLVFNGLILLSRYYNWLWIVFIFLGLSFLYQRFKNYFWLFFFLIVNELLFLFYSGFPISSQDFFTSGMFIRFLLPGILFLGILLGLGVFTFATWFSKLTRFSTLRLLVYLSLLIVPLSLLIKNLPKINALKNDFTAENMARDFLFTAGSDSILHLIDDTSIFNTEYVNLCLYEYKKVKIIPAGFSMEGLKKKYPELSLADNIENNNFLKKTLELNSPKFPIFISDSNKLENGLTIPYGLVFRYFAEGQKKPNSKEILKINEDLWANYHNPYNGILKWFQPATLTDVLRVYNNGARTTGTGLFFEKEYSGAELFFKKALIFDPEDSESRLFLALVLTEEKKCLEAENELKLLTIKKSQLIESYSLLVENARECFHDKGKEEYFTKIYEEKKSSFEGKLEDLDK